ncbi:hypothetical protein H5085_18375 [Pseudoalteromonas sp. SR43-6]|uniref:hypothetical protein n=1 Tax=Pseudoalteromonas TaxID=53246 RepID=UPI0015F90051|nr:MULTISPECIES: hypothetical protein [Pseudoalteromonas]MBB1291053.1 hypothetical protein [Pseudoalteromonas sp. SR41-5]MBB1352115.1 hypothetical protein [Pseudoalteromonas sp. SG45-3]MBB1359296.1 hypothetical protein [Pseudoalteromonas sp. SG45-6]MBB1376268.1 hypothetical protein [Pseudoalteromonas sp. SR43-6]MBB1415413.1 hypothetical protein [Pseudoalteromonas sp. SG43-8]
MLKKCITTSALILSLCACTSETESNLVKTKGIWAGFELVSDGNRTRVNAELNAGDANGSNIVLSDSDSLQAVVNNTAIELTKDTDFLDVDYQAYINATDDNQQFDIKFKRDDGINANSGVELPLNFIILTPSNNQTFSINSPLTVQLDGTDPNSTSQVELSSSCTNNNNETLLQSMLFALSTSRLEIDLQSLDMFSSSQVDQSKTCSLTVSVKRERLGSISGEFANQSYIKAQQSRAIKNMTLTF